ncbi:hypothetical protein D3C76_1867600 [compost metagenome]
MKKEQQEQRKNDYQHIGGKQLITDTKISEGPWNFQLHFDIRSRYSDGVEPVYFLKKVVK